MDYNIAITTFSLRYDFLENLIKQIRKFTDRRILIAINGEKDAKFDDTYRKRIMYLCYTYNEVYPIFFVELRGLSKMWNTLLVHSDTHHVMMLNDDVFIQDNIFETVKEHINSTEFEGLTLLNSSFSHFVVDRRLIDKLGYFDERLLGFGEEDGDITYRWYKNCDKSKIPLLWVNGLINVISNVRQDAVKKGSINNVEHKYSDFNRKYILDEKYKRNDNSTWKGFFDYPMDEVLPNDKNYCYESFFWENKNKLFK